ncbi:UPF0613 protein PB24D3.06c 1 [Stagonosporopsis vannaccii]|nr:UPF0613 protein PB24D3.06c 1 [Stagonosporopsis vannaccii]
MALPRPFLVTVHPFTSLASPHAYSCAYERGKTSSRNALVYIGGLTSGPHTALHISQALLSALDDAKLQYSIWECRIRSSYTGWGHSSLKDDVEDIAALVKHLRDLGKNKVVLLGSSTGCQDCMEYIRVAKKPEVDAYILQAPTSDRATAGMLMSPECYSRTLDFSKNLIAQGDKEQIMPKHLLPDIFTSPISAYRWHSLIAQGGDDDYFSDDLDDDRLTGTFGRINRPILILPSANDEMMPSWFPKRALLSRWLQAAPKGLASQLSDIVPAADHTLSAVEARQWFVDRAVQFLCSLDIQ